MKKRVSATIDPSTEKMLDEIMEKSNHRNYSHAIEDAIKLLWNKINVKDGKNEK